MVFGPMATGARVSYAYAIYLSLGHSPGKPGLISYGTFWWHHLYVKASAVKDEHASY